MAEFYDAIRQNVDAKAYIDAKAELAAVLERVLSCRAADPGDITNVARFRDLWEIRIQLGSFGLLMRIYETELDVLPVHIVALRAHAKKVAKLDRQQITELQNDEIDIAIRRWQKGRNDLWGLR
jgi:hypothetical protein